MLFKGRYMFADLVPRAIADQLEYEVESVWFMCGFRDPLQGYTHTHHHHHHLCVQEVKGSGEKEQ